VVNPRGPREGDDGGVVEPVENQQWPFLHYEQGGIK